MSWTYCTQHMAPHGSDWCTVSDRDKIPLKATTMEEAIEECRLKGLELYSDWCNEQEKKHGRDH